MKLTAKLPVWFRAYKSIATCAIRQAFACTRAAVTAIDRRPCRLVGRRLLIPCTILLLGCGGCAAIPLAAAGSLLGAAGSAASAGTEVYSLGKLDFSLWTTFDECRSAVGDAISDLQLHIQACEFVHHRKDEIVMKLEDDRKTRIEIRIDARTGELCQCRVDVGIFGSEPTAKLIMQRISSHLPKSQRQPGVAHPG